MAIPVVLVILISIQLFRWWRLKSLGLILFLNRGFVMWIVQTLYFSLTKQEGLEPMKAFQTMQSAMVLMEASVTTIIALCAYGSLLAIHKTCLKPLVEDGARAE